MRANELVSESAVEAIADKIEQNVLAPDHTLEDVQEACEKAATHEFAAVCVAPYVVEWAAAMLRGSGVRVCGTVGGPGYSGLRAKMNETRTCIEAGASEIDMAINLVAIKSGRYADVRQEIETLRKLTTGCTLKVILECGYLTDTEKARACEYAREAGADYIVTNTGLGKGGPRVRDIELLQRLTGRQMGIKAAGNVTTFRQVRDLIRGGATRIGTAVGETIVKESYDAEMD